MLEKLHPSDRNARSFWNLVCQPVEPVAPVDTASFLHCSDDDRAWWWQPDGNVRFSDEMNAWLAQCRSSLETLAREETAMQGTELLELLIGTLDDIQTRYRSLFAFREMFYDFMAHGESPMVQAAVRFLKQMAEQEEDCTVFLRRYLAVLGNLPLRKKVFGF